MGPTGLKHAPSATLLGESVQLHLQVFWWPQTLEFWNMIAINLRHVVTRSNTVLLHSFKIHDAFRIGPGAITFLSSATCVTSTSTVHTSQRV